LQVILGQLHFKGMLSKHNISKVSSIRTMVDSLVKSILRKYGLDEKLLIKLDLYSVK